MVETNNNVKKSTGMKAYDLIFWAIFIAMSLGGFTMVMFAALAHR